MLQQLPETGSQLLNYMKCPCDLVVCNDLLSISKNVTAETKAMRKLVTSGSYGNVNVVYHSIIFIPNRIQIGLSIEE